jgi:hypothetical protein
VALQLQTGEFKREVQQSEVAVSISPEGWQIVAGGCSEAKTTGTDLKGVALRRSARISSKSAASSSGTPSGCSFLPVSTGGLRFATTTGYFLATLRVASFTSTLIHNFLRIFGLEKYSTPSLRSSAPSL